MGKYEESGVRSQEKEKKEERRKKKENYSLTTNN
jgi:hypothetical protein